MQTKELIRKVTEKCLPLCEAEGLSLWDVTVEKEGRSYALAVYIDRDEGVFVEDCEKISRWLGWNGPSAVPSILNGPWAALWTCRSTRRGKA